MLCWITHMKNTTLNYMAIGNVLHHRIYEYLVVIEENVYIYIYINSALILSLYKSAVGTVGFTYSNGPGLQFNITMAFYLYRKSHCGDKTIFRPSHLHNEISYTGKMTSLYWIRALITQLRVFVTIRIYVSGYVPKLKLNLTSCVMLFTTYRW